MIIILVCSFIYVLAQCLHLLLGNNFKLVPQCCKYDELRKYYFASRVVPIWNSLSLPNEVVTAEY